MISFIMLFIVACIIFLTLGYLVLTDADGYLHAGQLIQISTHWEIFFDKKIFRFRHV